MHTPEYLATLNTPGIRALAREHNIQLTQNRSYKTKAQLISDIKKISILKTAGNPVRYAVQQYTIKEGGESYIYIPPKVPFTIITSITEMQNIIPTQSPPKILLPFFTNTIDITEESKNSFLGKIIKNKSNLFNTINNYAIIEYICHHTDLDVERLLHITRTNPTEYQLIVRNLGDTTMQKMKAIPTNTFADLLRTVATLNANGFVHFDIKQDNVMLYNDKLTLIDYGMSCVKDGLTERIIAMLSSKNGIATLYPLEVAYVNALHHASKTSTNKEAEIKRMMKMFVFNGFCGVAKQIYNKAYNITKEYQKNDALFFKDTYCIFGKKSQEYEIKRHHNGEIMFVDQDRIIDNIYDCLSKHEIDSLPHDKIDTFYLGLVLADLCKTDRMPTSRMQLKKCLTMDVSKRYTTQELYESFATRGGRVATIPTLPKLTTKQSKPATKNMVKDVRDQRMVREILKEFPNYYDQDFSKNKYIYAENDEDHTKSSDANTIIDNITRVLNSKKKQ